MTEAMRTGKEKREENLIPFEKGRSGNPNGRPKGAKNRSTIVRKWLEAGEKVKNPITGEEEQLTQEDIMTLALIKKARKGDVSAYKQLMDSGYGFPSQQIEHKVEEGIFEKLDIDIESDEGV